MPIISPRSKILVSGANGFIAIWIVKLLLEAGYTVRGTIRTTSKGAHLKNLFKEHGERLELIVVGDFEKEGAFDEAVKGVDAIAHTASPCHLNVSEPRELIDPAVKGTTGILESAYKYGKNIKRIVITSSTAAIITLFDHPQTFTEADWNEASITAVNERGKDSPRFDWYRASKALAEKAAWKFHEEKRGEVGWDLVVIHPPYVFGPVLHEVSNPESLNTSVSEWYNAVTTINSGGKSPELLTGSGTSYVDVRDLAEAHKLAFEKEKAGGERLIISAGSYVWQDWIDTANSLSLNRAHPLPRGHPGDRAPNAYVRNLDNTKAKQILGLKFRSMEGTTKDTLEDFERRGW